MSCGASHRATAPSVPWDARLLERIAVPAILHDHEGRFIHLNAAGERAFGYTSAAVRGKSYTDLVPRRSRRRLEELFRRCAEHGEPAEFETVFLDAECRLRGSRALYLPIHNAGRFVGLLVLAFEVTSPFEGTLATYAKLTSRQVEVLELAAAGVAPPQIALQLGLSLATVRNHLRNICRGLGVRTMLEAVAAARRLGFLAPAALGTRITL